MVVFYMVFATNNFMNSFSPHHIISSLFNYVNNVSRWFAVTVTTPIRT
jgi:hypothetical protein